jgi:asparagine synthase (glutamine-hydrolysing)
MRTAVRAPSATRRDSGCRASLPLLGPEVDGLVEGRLVPVLGQAEAERHELATETIADVADRGLLEQALYLDTHLFLPASLLICGDKMPMAASLEQRVPFLDVEMMRFVQRVPARARVRLRDGKRLHRRAMQQLLPREITKRPKHGFYSPWDSWLRESLGDEVERLYSSEGELSSLVEPAAVSRLVGAHRAGKANHKWILFCLLELAQWHRTFIGARERALA